ncbi:hypothetical protein CVT25_003507 [Psilocybe cyanescens]|uniref:C2H2-type domain-containing protein n=1 Tax=Psilocybe cyanescens TaxID=93625 RepID=A0A409WP21_PSICY|nr:hypothetical protein CVT25_003507 [Psilocybe cyanescens]
MTAFFRDVQSYSIKHATETPLTALDGLGSPSKDELQTSLFAEVIQTNPYHRHSVATTSSAALLWRSAQSQVKPYGCPNVDCNRTFTNIIGLNYHASQGYCNLFAESSQLSPSPSPSSVIQAKASIKDSQNITKSAARSFIRKLKLGSLSKVTGRLKDVRQNRQTPVEPAPASDNDVVHKQADTSRGRSKHRISRLASTPELSKPFRSETSPPSQLTKFPPPPPFDSRNTKSERQRMGQHKYPLHKRENLRREDPHREQNGIENGYSEHTTPGNHLRSRSLSSTRLSERDPVLSRPYSCRSSRSFPKSSSGDNSLLKPFSLTSPTYSISVSSSVTFEPGPDTQKSLNSLASTSRLAKPLPLSSHNLRREQKRNHRQGKRYLAHEDAPFISVGMYPRRVSSRSSFRSSSSIFSTERPVSLQSFSCLSVTSPKTSRPSSLHSSRSSISLSSSKRQSSNQSPVSQSLAFSRSAKRTSISLLPSWQSSPPPFVILEDFDSTHPLSGLIPSDTPREKIRQGFWNRRGDFLTADGYIVYAPPDRRYPEDLQTYPPPGIGFRDHNLQFTLHSPRPELPESIPSFGRPPERSYDSFVVYEYK